MPVRKVRSRSSRQVILATVLRAVAATTALVLIYYNLPFQGRFKGANLAVLVGGIAAFGMISWWGIRRIIASRTPRAVAVQVLSIALPLFLIIFAATYYLLSKQSPSSFNAHLGKTDALYFTVTVFSTVGFGDLVPVSDRARVIVMVQMLGDLAIIGAGVHVLTGAVRLSFERRGADPAGTDDGHQPNAAGEPGDSKATMLLAGTEQLGDTGSNRRPRPPDR